MATRLTQFDIEEVSGVANPANELPGFIVMKSTDAEALLKDVDTLEQDYAILFAALETVKPSMGDAPPEIQAAVDTLMTYIEGLFDESGDEEGAPAPNEGVPPSQPVALSAGDEEPKTFLARLLHRSTPTAKSADAKPATDKPAEPVEKSADTDARREAARKRRQERVTKAAQERSEMTEALKGIVTAVDALAGQVEQITAGQEEVTKTTEAVADALNATLDRVGRLEAQPASSGLATPAPVAKTADGVSAGRRALRSSLVHLATNPGSSVTLGQSD